ncbi:MAG: hypothetical protein R2712_12430 [Vicinamibacterales bacterium]
MLYNLFLTTLRKDTEQVATLVDEFDEWHARFTVQRPLMAGWQLPDFWLCVAEGGGRIGPQTQDFVERWFRLAYEASSPEASGRARPPGTCWNNASGR